MHYFLSVIRNFSFHGRAGRPEFWWFVLFLVLANIVLHVTSVLTGMTSADGDSGVVIAWPPLLLSALVFVQQMALNVRRFHDRNISGWWAAALVAVAALGSAVHPLITLAGVAPLLVIAALPGTAGPNKFGVDPKTLPPPAG